jgi:hypothetical protein
MNAELRKSTAVTAIQVKTLQQRLNKVSYAYTQRVSDRERREDGAEPANVKAARRLVARFDKTRRAKHSAAYQKAQAEIRDVANLIVFGDMTKALAAVEKIEAAAK